GDRHDRQEYGNGHGALRTRSARQAQGQTRTQQRQQDRERDEQLGSHGRSSCSSSTGVSLLTRGAGLGSCGLSSRSGTGRTSDPSSSLTSSSASSGLAVTVRSKASEASSAAASRRIAASSTSSCTSSWPSSCLLRYGFARTNDTVRGVMTVAVSPIACGSGSAMSRAAYSPNSGGSPGSPLATMNPGLTPLLRITSPIRT